MRYTMTHGIAAFIELVDESGQKFDCIQADTATGFVVGVGARRNELAVAMPFGVSRRIRERFERVFAVPLLERSAWIDVNKTETFEVAS